MLWKRTYINIIKKLKYKLLIRRVLVGVESCTSLSSKFLVQVDIDLEP